MDAFRRRFMIRNPPWRGETWPFISACFLASVLWRSLQYCECGVSNDEREQGDLRVTRYRLLVPQKIRS